MPWWRSGQGNVWEGVRSGNGGIYLKSSDFDEHGVFDPLLPTPNAQSDDENAPPNPVGLGVGLSAFQRQTPVPSEMPTPLVCALYAQLAAHVETPDAARRGNAAGRCRAPTAARSRWIRTSR